MALAPVLPRDESKEELARFKADCEKMGLFEKYKHLFEPTKPVKKVIKKTKKEEK